MIIKDIKGFEGYTITSTGVVYGKRKNTPLVYNDVRGHKQVTLCNSSTDRLRIYVHRLMWMTFVGDIPEDKVIDHIDGDRANNELDNLQCITQSQNLRKGIRSIYTLPDYVSVNKRKGNRQDTYTYRRLVNGKRKTLKTSTDLNTVLKFAKNYTDE